MRVRREPGTVAGCLQDEWGVIHSPYGAFNPVTGEGLPIDAPASFMERVLADLIDEGLIGTDRANLSPRQTDPGH